MTRILFVFSSLFSLGLASAGDTENTSLAEQSVRALTQVYCVNCHGDEDQREGDVGLKGLSLERLNSDAVLVRQLLHVLETREMPPEDVTQPNPELRKAAQKALRSILPTAIANSTERVRAPIRRMNRFQYNNAVIDLFGLDCIVFTLPEKGMRVHKDYFDPASGVMPQVVSVGNRPLGKSQLIEPRLAGVAAFPQDLRAEHGYDNRGDHLSLSPLLMEDFLKLSHSITDSPDFVPRNVSIWPEFFEKPSKDTDLDREIRERLQPFLTKAFRHPVHDPIVQRYAQFAIQKIDSGVPFTAAMKSCAAAAIASPNFLYLYEKEVADVIGSEGSKIDDLELASRLSFFLWGSLPDESLLTLAAQGKLSRPDVLNQQIDRMLRDKKLKRFCDSFPSQWLQLDRIISSVPNRKTYPSFYFSKYRMSMHMMLEPLLLFETVLIENLPITQLIDTDFTYRSARLEKAYGELANAMPPGSRGGGVTVLAFHRIPVKDRRSGGVITNAAVMTMTSGPDRTQPITRGAWVAGVIFNDPPEPPPADVPSLPETPHPDEEHLTLRERLAAHRERSDCRGCHEQIDPLGFALENFSPVGTWRSTYENGRETDVSGTLFKQYDFSNIAEFKDAILANKDRFCRSLAGHLLSFALARELSTSDQIALDEITKAVAADGYTMQSLIRQIILSTPFRT